MTAEEPIELLAERPVKPLRLHLSDGRIRDIRHPEMAVVGDRDTDLLPFDDRCSKRFGLEPLADARKLASE